MGLFDTIAAQAGGLAGSELKGIIPAKVGSILTTASNVGIQLADGNLLGAAASVATAFSSKFPLGAEVATQLYFMNTPTPLFGGITPTEAQRIYDYVQGLNLTKKNLFLVEVSELAVSSDTFLPGPSYLSTDGARAFNLFVTDVEYSAITLSGDKHRIGAATMDSVGAFEPVELHLTTMDDQLGSVKRWFEYKAGLTVYIDGTVGVPAEYLVRIRILHSFINNESNQNGYENVYLMRPVSINAGLSRREDGLQEIQMNFTQFDTFVAA